MGLLEIVDELNAARQLAVAAWLACQSPGMPSPERSAIRTVLDIARKKLDDIGAALDTLIKCNPDRA